MSSITTETAGDRELQELRAENKRFREALERIAKFKQEEGWDRDDADSCAEIAIEALSGSTTSAY